MFRALQCPSCGGALPPSARRRPVTCGFCGATVALDVKLVRAADYRAALARFQAAEVAERPVRVGGHAYRILGRVGRGESSDVLAAERVSPIPERVLLKILRVEDDAERLQHEDQVLRALRASKAPGAPHFSRVLPRPVAVGRAAGTERWVAVQGHRPGFTADLTALRGALPGGVDPRHGVWIWRRLLELLAFVHDAGWRHDAVLPQHVLVHPRDHGVTLVGWTVASALRAPLQAHLQGAEPFYPRSGRARPEADVVMSARAVLWLLGAEDLERAPSHVPDAMARLLERAAAGEGELAPRALAGAMGAAAREAYGPPAFVPLNLPQAEEESR